MHLVTPCIVQRIKREGFASPLQLHELRNELRSVGAGGVVEEMDGDVRSALVLATGPPPRVAANPTPPPSILILGAPYVRTYVQ